LNVADKGGETDHIEPEPSHLSNFGGGESSLFDYRVRYPFRGPLFSLTARILNLCSKVDVPFGDAVWDYLKGCLMDSQASIKVMELAISGNIKVDFGTTTFCLHGLLLEPWGSPSGSNVDRRVKR
jgi:hypothetical protein